MLQTRFSVVSSNSFTLESDQFLSNLKRTKLNLSYLHSSNVITFILHLCVLTFKGSVHCTQRSVRISTFVRDKKTITSVKVPAL